MEGAEAAAKRGAREWLRGPALDLYEHLEATGQIARLKQMPQLGAVTWVHPEIKHTRWDYVELLLRLATCVDRVESLSHDMGELEIEGHAVGTARDLLQCWAMLQNCGHLWGTFATERLVLDALVEPGRARDLFIRGMTTQADREFAEHVLGNYLLFKVNWALAVGFLHTLPQHQSPAGRPIWLAMLRAYRNFGGNDTRTRRLYLGQRRLRRLAYTHLDLVNAALPVVTDLDAFERGPADQLESFLSRRDDPFNAVLEHVRRYIPGEIYYAPDAVLVHRLLELHAGAEMKRELTAAASPQDLFAQLEAMKREEAWPVVRQVVKAFRRGDYVHLHRIGWPRPASMDKDSWHATVHPVQSQVERELGAGSLIQVNVPNDRTERWCDFYVRRDIKPADLARTLAVICDSMMRPPAAAERFPAPQPCQGAQVRDLVSAVLSLMLRDSKRVRVKESSELAGASSFLLVHSRNDGYVQREIERLRLACTEDPRRHELDVLDTALLAEPARGFRAVMLGGFEVERRSENSPGDAEFDGAYIDVETSGARLHLVEAKSTLNSHAAMRQLRRRLRRLGWSEGSQVVSIEGGAEATVPLRLLGRG